MLMLNHPNIVNLEEVLEDEENVFFVMELCGGGALSEHVAIEVTYFNKNLLKMIL